MTGANEITTITATDRLTTFMTPISAAFGVVIIRAKMVAKPHANHIYIGEQRAWAAEAVEGGRIIGELIGRCDRLDAR